MKLSIAAVVLATGAAAFDKLQRTYYKTLSKNAHIDGL